MDIINQWLPAEEGSSRVLNQKDDDDILPSTFAFIIGGTAWGILICQGLGRSVANHDLLSGALHGPFTEFLLCVGLNAIIMAVTQMGYFTQTAYAILAMVLFMLGRDLYNARIISKGDNDQRVQAALSWAFPPFVFSREFREKYMAEMTGDINTLTCDSMYGDFLYTDFRRVLLLSIGQLILLSMFVSGLIIRGAPPFEDLRSYRFYWIGIIIEACYIAGKNQLSSPYDNYAFFINVLRAARQDLVCVADSNEELRRALKYSDATLWIRFILYLTVNNTGLILILTSLPMQLSWSEEPTEFVLNAVAAFFIVELDDLHQEIVYKMIAATTGSSTQAQSTSLAKQKRAETVELESSQERQEGDALETSGHSWEV